MINTFLHIKHTKQKANEATPRFVVLYHNLKRKNNKKNKYFQLSPIQYLDLHTFLSSGSLSQTLLSVENRIPLKPVVEALRDVALFHYPTCTDSIKPSLQFSCNFAVFNASEESPFPSYFYKL
jgi:hypothetical protein